ncbi:MAG: hypothetical protein ACREPL_00710 [Rhodanobacteraceae bacterium]
MSYSGGWRPHIETALTLDVGRLAKLGAIRDGASGSLDWQSGASVGFRATLHDGVGTLTLDYATGRDGERKAITCTVPLVTLPCHYGGRRWYFVCPYTGRRALKLYKWAPIDWFCHRTAIRPRPTYACQRTGGADRVTAQRWALRRKLHDDVSDLCGEPVKPERMRWRTFARYAARDAELEAREGVYLARLLGKVGVDCRGLA